MLSVVASSCKNNCAESVSDRTRNSVAQRSLARVIHMPTRRRHRAFEPALGCFVSTPPVRSTLNSALAGGVSIGYGVTVDANTSVRLFTLLFVCTKNALKFVPLFARP